MHGLIVGESAGISECGNEIAALQYQNYGSAANAEAG
jgi:hypothetical protein